MLAAIRPASTELEILTDAVSQLDIELCNLSLHRGEVHDKYMEHLVATEHQCGSMTQKECIADELHSLMAFEREATVRLLQDGLQSMQAQKNMVDEASCQREILNRAPLPPPATRALRFPLGGT